MTAMYWDSETKGDIRDSPENSSTTEQAGENIAHESSSKITKLKSQPLVLGFEQVAQICQNDNSSREVWSIVKPQNILQMQCTRHNGQSRV